MEVQNFILIVESILLLYLAFYVLYRNWGQPVATAFFVMTFGAGAWVLGNGLDRSIQSDLISRLPYVGAILVAIGFFFFSFYFPYPHKRLQRWMFSFPIILGLGLIIFLYYGDWFFEKIIWARDHTDVGIGPLFHVFNVYFLILWVWGIANLLSKFRYAQGIHYWQLKNIFYALSVSLIAGVTTNLFLPWFGIWSFGWVGPMFSIFYFGFVGYILLKKYKE